MVTCLFVLNPITADYLQPLTTSNSLHIDPAHHINHWLVNIQVDHLGWLDGSYWPSSPVGWFNWPVAFNGSNSAVAPTAAVEGAAAPADWAVSSKHHGSPTVSLVEKGIGYGIGIEIVEMAGSLTCLVAGIAWYIYHDWKPESLNMLVPARASLANYYIPARVYLVWT